MKPRPEAPANGIPAIAPLMHDLRQLAAAVVAVRAKARALGLFANDRELLECPGCGLMENVAIDGRLFTCRPETLDEDTELRFEEVSPNCFRCPACGAAVREVAND
jgi:hypothetical protein